MTGGVGKKPNCELDHPPLLSSAPHPSISGGRYSPTPPQGQGENLPLVSPNALQFLR